MGPIESSMYIFSVKQWREASCPVDFWITHMPDSTIKLCNIVIEDLDCPLAEDFNMTMIALWAIEQGSLNDIDFTEDEFAARWHLFSTAILNEYLRRKGFIRQVEAGNWLDKRFATTALGRKELE